MEIWKAVKGYEGYYKVSNLGGVKRIISRNCASERIRKIQYKKNGYAVVMLSVKQKYKLAYVHRLVASAFIDNPENKEQVNHKDLNKKNNNYLNLEWVTHKENMVHANKSKKWSNNVKKGMNSERSVKVSQYSKEGKKIKDWFCISDAARFLNISTGDITVCCQGKRKSSLGFQWRYGHGDDSISALEYRRKKVLKMDMDGCVIKEYENSFIAAKDNKLHHSGIWNCCNNKNNSCGGFKWAYK